MNRYAVIFSEPETGEGMLAFVDAPTPGHAQDDCNDAVQDNRSIFEGHVFTIWPIPVAGQQCKACGCSAHSGLCPACGLCN